MKRKDFKYFESSLYFYCIYICKMNSYTSEVIDGGRFKIARMVRLDKRIFSSVDEFINIQQRGVEVLTQVCYREAKKYKEERDELIRKFGSEVKNIISNLSK